MELLLNALWLFVALLVIALACATSDVRAAHATRRRICTFVAVGCIALALFPVISMSDDLNGEQVAVQEAWTATKKLRSHITAPAAVPDATLPPSLPAHSPYWYVVSAVSTETLVNAYSASLPRISGRAPPARFL